MGPQRLWIALVISVSASLAPITAGAGESPVVHFDMPPIAVAEPIAVSEPAAIANAGPTSPSMVTIHLVLSSMIESADARVDQWLVRCQPRDTAVSIADYWPRTETSSDVQTPIQVKETKEENNAFGLNVDGVYVLRGAAGVDHAKKNVDTVQFDRAAPEQAVIASGTINRGRGVYFKLRWTARQVLEGEKAFRLTLRVPPTWRGGLIDVSVIAQSEKKSFAGWDQETKTIGAEHFVVAAYRQGDQDAADMARKLSDAECALRNSATRIGEQRGPSLPSMLRHVARKLDLDSDRPDHRWLSRLLLGQADPHLDKEISKLPMPLRVAVLDYAELRDDFCTISESTPDARVLVAKPVIE